MDKVEIAKYGYDRNRDSENDPVLKILVEKTSPEGIKTQKRMRYHLDEQNVINALENILDTNEKLRQQEREQTQTTIKNTNSTGNNPKPTISKNWQKKLKSQRVQSLSRDRLDPIRKHETRLRTFST